MKFTSSVAFAAGLLVSMVSAQVTYDNATDTWNCPVANGSYCAGDSLSTPVVILCSNGKGTPGNCIPHNWNRPPINVYYSPCYQSSPEAGDASCAKNCVVYPDAGLPFDVPGSCNASYYDTIDVTGGSVTTTCHTGLGPYSNMTSTLCNDTIHANATMNGTSSSNSSSHGGPTSTSSSGGSHTGTATASPHTGAGMVNSVAPIAVYVVLGLLALTL